MHALYLGLLTAPTWFSKKSLFKKESIVDLLFLKTQGGLIAVKENKMSLKNSKNQSNTRYIDFCVFIFLNLILASGTEFGI
jgi:hypothetical protein